MSQTQLMQNKQLLLILLLINSMFMQAQNRIEQALDEYADGSVEYISTDELAKLISNNQNVQILDTRKKEEFEVSRLENAIHVGYKNFEINQFQDQLNINQQIIVYCSIGVRSEEIGEKLKTAGFENVKNLRGGLFKWFNEDRQIIDDNDKSTHNIHGYNKKWSRYLKRGEVVY